MISLFLILYMSPLHKNDKTAMPSLLPKSLISSDLFPESTSKSDVIFRLRSIGLRLASPAKIKRWAFKFDGKKPLTGQIRNAKTVNYKTLLPEKGGLFCPTVFGSSRDHQRHKLGYLRLAVPAAHLWYLKATPSYLSLLLNKKRKVIQRLVYAQSCVSFSQQTFYRTTPLNIGLSISNVSCLINFKTAKNVFNHVTPYNHQSIRSNVEPITDFSIQKENIKPYDLNLVDQVVKFDALLNNKTVINNHVVLPLLFWNKHLLNKTNQFAKLKQLNKIEQWKKTGTMNLSQRKQPELNNHPFSMELFSCLITKTIDNQQLKQLSPGPRSWQSIDSETKEENLSPLLKRFNETQNYQRFYQSVDTDTYFISQEKLNPALQAYYGVTKNQKSSMYQHYFWLIYSHKNFLRWLFFLNLTHQIKLYNALEVFLETSIRKNKINQSINNNFKTVITLLDTTITCEQLENQNLVFYGSKIQKQAFQSNQTFNNSKSFLNQLKPLTKSGHNWRKSDLSQVNGLKSTLSHEVLALKQWLKNKALKIKQLKLFKKTHVLLNLIETMVFQLPSKKLTYEALNLNRYLKVLRFKNHKNNLVLKKKRIKTHDTFTLISEDLTYDLNKILFGQMETEKTQDFFLANAKRLHYYKAPYKKHINQHYGTEYYQGRFGDQSFLPLYSRNDNVGFGLPLAHCFPYIPMWMFYKINGNKWFESKQKLLKCLKNYFINTDLNQLKWRSSSKSLNIWLKTLDSKVLNENQTYKQTNTFNRSKSLNKKVKDNALKSLSLLKFQCELKQCQIKNLNNFSNNVLFSHITLRNSKFDSRVSHHEIETVVAYIKNNQYYFKKQLKLFNVVWQGEVLNLDNLAITLVFDPAFKKQYKQVLKCDKIEETKRKILNSWLKRENKKTNKQQSKLKLYPLRKVYKKKADREDQMETREINKQNEFFFVNIATVYTVQRIKAKFFNDVAKNFAKTWPSPKKLKSLLKCYVNTFWYNPSDELIFNENVLINEAKQKLEQYHTQFNQEIVKNLKGKIFQLDYISLTFRYGHIHKGYRQLKSNRLKNPLGHKNYRLFVKEKLALSVNKSVCISQFKNHSKDLLFEKAGLCQSLKPNHKRFILESDLNSNFNFLKKQRLIYFILMRLQKNVSIFLETIKTMESSWYSKLSQNQLYYLCPFERFNYFELVDQTNLNQFLNADFSFIQKSQEYDCLKVRLPFSNPVNHGLNGSVSSISPSNKRWIKLDSTCNGSTLILNHRWNGSAWFMLKEVLKSNNGLEKKCIRGDLRSKSEGCSFSSFSSFKSDKRYSATALNNSICLLNKQHYSKLKLWQNVHWKNESKLFERLIKVKKPLNSLLSLINHKVNFFLLVSKPSLALDIDEIPEFKTPSIKSYVQFENPYTQYSRTSTLLEKEVAKYNKVEFKKEIRFNYKQRRLFYQQEKLLAVLNIDFNQKPKNIVNQCANYFSLKTKLIKAKSVRLLLAYRLRARFSNASANLKQLLWNLNLNLNFSSMNFDSCLLALDGLLYNRLFIRKRTIATNTIKHMVGDSLDTFLNAKSINKNTYYVVEQGFTWDSNEQYDSLTHYMGTRPRPHDIIVPAYVERSMTYASVKTGAWAVRSLLDQFKPFQQRRNQLQHQVPKYKEKFLFHRYYNGFASKLIYFTNKALMYKRFLKILHHYPASRKPVDWFDFRAIANSRYKSPAYFALRQRRALIFYRRRLNKIIVKRNILNRRIKFLRPWLNDAVKPSWMIIDLLPILPPSLRPILPLSGGQFAMADLNKLYQQVIYRNGRLREYPAFPEPDARRLELEDAYAAFGKFFCFYYRLLQEAVDALLDNGKSDSKVVLNNQDQPLKSLSEGLRGKKGRFRQNLLGKRVDYSGRSVIVVGPQLQVHQCGLPKQMALELFQPFLIAQLIKQGYATNFTMAKKHIKNKTPIVWTILKQLMLNRPLLLNRAPTLHRLGIQAFQPLLINGRAILLHPLVCSAFNADFDGDQMAVHVPLSYSSCSEAWKLMWSRNNLFSLATGEPNLTPTQDMVLGCYYLSTYDQIKNQFTFTTPMKQLWFNQLTEVIQAYDHNYIDLHQMIWLKWSKNVEFDLVYQPCLEFQLDNKGYQRAYYINYCHFYKGFSWIRTTVGRILLNQLIFDLIT